MSKEFCRYLVRQAIKYGWIKLPSYVVDVDEIVRAKQRASVRRCMRRKRGSKGFRIE